MADFWDELKKDLQASWLELRLGWLQAWAGLRNALRRARGERVDYVVLRLSGPLPERAGPPRGFFQRRLLPPEPLSLQALNAQLQAIAEAENVRGVIFVLGQLSPGGLATLQNVRRSLERLRASGKEAVVFTPYLDLTHYYVASAADRIVAPPSSQFELLGLRVETFFLREALQQVGVEADIVQISPYKTAGNMFDKAEMTPEQREQLTWLLDDNYDLITADIAAGRGLPQERVQALIDRAPLVPEEALEAGLVDALAYEDELATLLAPEDAETDEKESRPRARLLSWQRAAPLLLEKPRLYLDRYIGVVSLEGMIVTGESQQPPVDLPLPFGSGLLAGHETINRTLRRAERNDRMAALVFHVDSGGGSALASDLIWRQLQQVARKKPVLIYMGNTAASGGYYVAAGGARILCQPATVTGSIGVLAGRFNTDGLYEKLQVNRTVLQRGEHANLYSDAGPLEPGERELLWRMVVHTYEQFLDVVAEGRDLEREALDGIAGGRVWTGRQARERGLVDGFGDFVDAVEAAAGLANLRPAGYERVAVADLYPARRRGRLPLALGAGQNVSGLLSRYQRLFGETLLLLPFRLRWH